MCRSWSISTKAFVPVVIGLLMATAVSGCATKRYGRVQPLSDAEKRAYSCEDIDIEISKVRAFQEQIKDEADIDAKSVAGFLGDFGVGNRLERGNAEESAEERLEQLEDLQQMKGCYS